MTPCFCRHRDASFQRGWFITPFRRFARDRLGSIVARIPRSASTISVTLSSAGASYSGMRMVPISTTPWPRFRPMSATSKYPTPTGISLAFPISWRSLASASRFSRLPWGTAVMTDPVLTPSFPALLQRFFVEHLAKHRAVSPRTIAAYRDTFRLLLDFAEATIGKAPTAIAMTDLDAKLILAFLDHLEGIVRTLCVAATHGWRLCGPS